MWISFHPQLVGEEPAGIIEELRQLIACLDFSVVSTTHEFDWALKASALLPMASWAEEVGTYTNFEGRVQITNRAVDPPGAAQPLHVFMAELLRLAGVPVSTDPRGIFESLAREVPGYDGMDYQSIGLAGIAQIEEVAR
jgi:NADH-quinone oxidoreductase subunit G